MISQHCFHPTEIEARTLPKFIILWLTVWNVGLVINFYMRTTNSVR